MRSRPVWILGLLFAAGCAWGTETADADRIIAFTTPLQTIDEAWKDRIRLADGRAVIHGGGGSGAAGYAVTLDLSARSDACLALLVQTGAANTAKQVCVRLTDQDARTCSWVFALPPPGDHLVQVCARDGASLAVPNRPDPRDGGYNDLRRISACQLAGDRDDAGVIDIQVAAVLTVAPDAAARTAREQLSAYHKKVAGWAAARNAIEAKFVAAFPEITVPVAPATPGRRTIRAYHIGNSLTFKALSHQYTTWSPLAYEERVIAFMDGRGVRYAPGWHISWGASLPSIAAHPFEPAVSNAGPAGKALVDYTWDVLTLQLWGCDVAGDVAAASRFIAMGVAKNPELQPYLVETWVHKEKTLSPDFATQWNRPWAPDQRWGIPPLHCQAYGRVVFDRLRQATPALRHPLRLIPVGSVLYELDRRMRAGQVPGFTRVEELYNDEVHLTENGNYVALETFFAVILGRDPRGLPRTAMFPTVNDAFAAVVQDAVWTVVCANPDTGVASAPAR